MDTIEPAKTALLLIDPQREYFDEGRPLYTPNAETIRGNLVRLREAADGAGVQTVLVKHVQPAGPDARAFVEGTPWVEPIPELSPRERDIVVEKDRYSAFVRTPLGDLLQERGINTVIVTGLMTNYCSETTARHAHDLDYRVIFVTDANAGPDMQDVGFGPVSHEDVMRTVATSLAGGIADVIDTDEALARMKSR